MRHDEFPLFEIHKGKASIKLYPSGLEIDNTIGNSSYFRLSHVELRALADEISKNMEVALAARAIAELKETKPVKLAGLFPLFDMMDTDTIANIFYGKLDEFVSPETKNRLVTAINNQISVIEEREKDEYNAILSA
jgi:hypothetical protein